MARANPPPQPNRLLTLAAICVIVAGLSLAREVLIPLALAMLLTFLLTPLVMRLERRRLGRVPSVIIVVTLALAVLAAVGYGVFSQAEELGTKLPTYSENITAKLSAIQPKSGGMLSRLLKTPEALAKRVNAQLAEPTTSTSEPTTKTSITESGETTTEISGSRANPMWVIIGGEASSPLRTIQSTIGPLLGPLGTAGMVIVFAVFMLLAREDLRDRLIRLVGHGRLTITTQALDDAGKRISRYLLMQSMVNSIYGVTISIGLWFIGVPNPLLFGLLCALLRFVPYIGAWIGMAFPILVALGKFSQTTPVVETVGLFVVVELITNNLLEPWLYASSTGISTVAVLVAAVFWTWLWGPVGLLLSTPLTVVLVVIGKYVPQMAFLDIILGDEPVLEPPERLYQRLLALDQEEATELARDLRAKSSLEETYDTVLLPALAMAEHDFHRGHLDQEHLRFIRSAIRDIVEELGEAQREELAKANPAAAPAEVAHENRVNAILLPAREEGDAVVGLMLAQMLEQRGFSTRLIEVAQLASEMLEEIERCTPDIAIISALPPSAVVHARYLCKRIHSRFHEQRLLVGLWGFTGDLTKVKDRVARASNVKVVTSLRDAITQMQSLATPAGVGK